MSETVKRLHEEFLIDETLLSDVLDKFELKNNA
jgi:hypothetical protein